MGERMTCPGCFLHTSSVLHAFADDEPCPSCGLSAEAAIEIDSIRSGRADEKLKEQLTEALKEVDRLRSTAIRLHRLLAGIQTNEIDKEIKKTREILYPKTI